jgi:hypothetical protein
VWSEQPIHYKEAKHFSVTGTDMDVRWPVYSTLMGFDLDLPCVIGYTIFNDCSARDAQMKEMVGQLGPAKGKDFWKGVPWLKRPRQKREPRLR